MEEINIEETEEEETETETETEVEIEVELESESEVEQTEDDERSFADEKQFRSAAIRSEYIDSENRRVRIALTSETPVSRSFGLEILDHSAESIDASFMSQGRSPLLKDHNTSEQIGVVENYFIDKTAKRTIAEVRFGKSDLANEIFNDVKDGIRQNVSVGYNITSMERDDSFEEVAYRVNGWVPLEASIVSIPADQSQNVGIARSDDAAKELPDIEAEGVKPEAVKSGVNINLNIGKTMEEEIKQIDVEEVKAETVSKTIEQIAKQNDEILELGSRHNQQDLSRQAIKEGTDLEMFRGQLLNAIPSGQPLETADIGLTE